MMHTVLRYALWDMQLVLQTVEDRKVPVPHTSDLDVAEVLRHHAGISTAELLLQGLDHLPGLEEAEYRVCELACTGSPSAACSILLASFLLADVRCGGAP